jgi:uncharacterized protein (TIGR02599 family)
MAPPPPPRGHRRARTPAFTLLETLVATAVFLAILASAFTVFDQSSKAIRQSTTQLDSFQTARAAFDVMTRKLSQATLNTYWDYFDKNGTPYRLAANPANFAPAQYGRYSDLHFTSGPAADLLSSALPPDYTATTTQGVFFSAPLGLTGDADYQGLPDTLSACGFFVAFGSSRATRPAFIQAPDNYRWRLMELSSATENFAAMKTATGTSWFTDAVKAGQVRAVAENVIALVIWPRLPLQEDAAGTALAADFRYDSRTAAAWTGTPPRQPVQAHQLPPVLQVTMVVIDETTARRWENGAAPPPQVTAALDGLFTNDVTRVPQNLEELERRLAESRAQYRVFTSSIAMREAKWSP